MMMMMSRLGFWTLERGHQHHPHHRSPKRRNNFATGGGKTYALLNLIMPKRRGEKISKNVRLKNFNFFFVFGKTKKKRKKKRDDDDDIIIIVILFIVGL